MLLAGDFSRRVKETRAGQQSDVTVLHSPRGVAGRA
jgi:hypothetical protein